MENIKSNGFLRALLFDILGLLVSVLMIYVTSRAVTGISAAMAYDATMSVKKNLLYENVNNMIIYIDNEKDAYVKEHPDASEEEIESSLQQIVRNRIYTEEHLDGAYMWIQKVLDYNGGDNYAIRLIHPNLPDTEGCYLSTEEVNQMGMKAYEIELEGIKADGEIYQNYAFKKLESDEVSEKVTYAKLYKPFDWIICMGVNLDDIDHYRLQAQARIHSYQTIIMSTVISLWLLLLFVIFFIFRRTQIGTYEKKNKELESKLNVDVLTGASSRSYGERLLASEFKEFQSGKRDTLLLMMDIDYYKQFNDNYGHEVGDKVLKAFVTAIRESVRITDSVIRWGGDEFIVVLQKVSPDMMQAMADKILDAIRSITLEEMPASQKITSSVGMTYFDIADTDYKDIISRADAALYKAKEAGRNNWKTA
ncbi:diguanylate cyclase (GGDEF) domain-containing protein [Lachnospiraceae bacterium G11]|nr:diguanylate cyclase (GGDEF) domain-containing protein [Lachnospiraceae bacterium G11]